MSGHADIESTGVAVIGARIAQWRRRRGGMSQTALADLAGISQSMISRFETGALPLTSKSTQVAIARALNISVAQLLGQPDESPRDPARDRANRFVPAIRSSLVALSVGERIRPTRGLEDLRAAVVALNTDRVNADYVSVAAALPALLNELAAYGNDAGPALVEALFCGRSMLKAIGHQDLALNAAAVGRTVAEAYGDPAWVGQAAYSWIVAFPPETAGLGARLAARLADEMQPLTSREGRETYGMLHLVAALAAAIDLQADDAWAHLDEAAQVADALGEPDPYGPSLAGINGQWFGPTNLELWRVALAAELQDPGRALAVRDRIDLSVLPVPNRQVYFHIDLARTLADADRDVEAMTSLAAAERVAPQHFRFSPGARELVATIIHRAKRRALPDRVVGMAHRLGLDPL